MANPAKPPTATNVPGRVTSDGLFVELDRAGWLALGDPGPGTRLIVEEVDGSLVAAEVVEVDGGKRVRAHDRVSSGCTVRRPLP